jgi:hypothetical protein
LTGYTWIQTGVTSYTGNARLQNRLDSDFSLGAMIHLNSIWIQESYGKVNGIPNSQPIRKRSIKRLG